MESIYTLSPKTYVHDVQDYLDERYDEIDERVSVHGVKTANQGEETVSIDDIIRISEQNATLAGKEPHRHAIGLHIHYKQKEGDKYCQAVASLYNKDQPITSMSPWVKREKTAIRDALDEVFSKEYEANRPRFK
jgi:hypothetical protein